MKFDKALFYLKKEKSLIGVMIVHVDDFLWAGSQEFSDLVISPLKKVLKVSNKATTAFRYVGVDLEQSSGCIHMKQNVYIQAIKPIIVEKLESTEPRRPATSREHKDFQSLVGQFNWTVTMTRPDMAFTCSELGSVQSKPSLNDIKKANKAVREITTIECALKFSPLDINSMQIKVFADASYANIIDGGSQGGYIIFLVDKYERCNPVSWSSKRLQRVARSTLSAETQSAVEALESGCLLKQVLNELLETVDLKIELQTDSKSMFDAVHTTNLMLDKRLRVDIASLREMHNKNEVVTKCIEASQQLADALMKRSASKSNLLHVLQAGRLP